MKQSRFLDKMEVVKLDIKSRQGLPLYRVMNTARYYSESLDKVFTIPKGFVTDFATIPKLLQWLFPSGGEYKWECVLHDVFYDVTSVDITREEADNVFKGAMEASGIGWWKVWCLYNAVRVFGEGYFSERKL